MTGTKRTAAAAAGLALAAALAAGCGSSHAATPKPAPRHLSTLQACQRLRADVLRNGGTLDQPTASYVRAHARGRLAADLAAADVSGANRDGDAWTYLSLLAYDCRATGVTIPTP